ncbi:MAG: ribosome biogenesis GTP-binding protein YsxC, partial [Synergistaceae bacterium]|nr:ribosome biogenesis GTP-binding protein YsxC [Synergistaceae bacterium]
MSEVWKVRTEATAYLPNQFPPPSLPEIAVAGRSNVGKSSLINRLIGVRLARVAAAPGKTRSVNFFLVEGVPDPFRLVDLPGYGYASRSKGERIKWSSLIESYISRRKNLALILHLVDFRHGLLENDRALQDWVRSMKIPLLVAFTKGDKISRS